MKFDFKCPIKLIDCTTIISKFNNKFKSIKIIIHAFLIEVLERILRKVLMIIYATEESIKKFI